MIALKAGVGHSLTVIFLGMMAQSDAVFHCHHIEWIRGIIAYSLACSQSLWQVCVGALVNIHVGSMLSYSAGMTVQVSPGTCSVKPVSQVHLETRLSLSLAGAPKGPLLTFNILCVCRL